MKTKILALTLGLLLISANAFAQGACNLSGSHGEGVKSLHDSSSRE